MLEAAMKVLLAGASGAIGIPLTRQLVAAGHDVIGLSSTTTNHGRLRALGAETVVADAMDRDALLRAVDGLQADAVIHQLTALKNASPRVRADDPNNMLRVRGTANLLDASSLVGARRLLTQSLIFGYGYGDHGTREFTEHDPFGHPQGGYADPVISALESAERQTFAAEGIESMTLRYGIFYGPNTFSDLFVNMMRRRLFAIPRGGGGTTSWIHVDDAAAATIAALERGGTGRAYNIVDDEPVDWRDFTWALSDAFRTPRPWEVPRLALRLLAPYLEVMMMSTLRVSNARAREELGWTPQLSTYRDGIRPTTASSDAAA
jgi:nucleoside-diphosphate-sugar epimerase